MPSHRPYVNRFSRQTITKNINARLYAANRSATSVSVQVRCASANPQDARFPFVENVMGALSQPHVHDVGVIVQYRNAKGRLIHSRYRMFFKRHIDLPLNRRLNVKGDIVIMRMAAKSFSSVVNLRRSDVEVADFIVESLAEKLRDFQGPKRKILHAEVLVMPQELRTDRT